MNVRQNRAKAQTATVTPDTRITVEDVRKRLYMLVHDRVKQGDKRAERLREWLDAQEPGRPPFVARWTDTNGQIDKAVIRAGRRVLGLSSQSVGAKGIERVENTLGVSLAQSEVLLQPVPSFLRRIAKEWSEGLGFSSKSASDLLLSMLEKELSRLDKAIAAKAKTDKATDEARERYFAMLERRASGVPFGEADYARLYRLSDAMAAARDARDEAHNRMGAAFREDAWLSIVDGFRWLLAWVAAVSLWSRLFDGRELRTEDGSRGLYSTLKDTLFQYDSGLLSVVAFRTVPTLRGSEAGGSVIHFLDHWVQENSTPLEGETDARVSLDSYRADRLANGEWRTHMQALRDLLERFNTYTPIGFVQLRGKGAHKYVPTLLARTVAAERGEIEGFRVSVYGMRLFARAGKAEEFYRSMTEAIPVSLRIVRRQAERYFPAMLREYKPSQTVFNLAPAFDQGGGLYYHNGKTVVLFPHSYTLPRAMATTLVHEIGHHVWRDFLSPAKQQVWIDAVEKDAPYDLTILREAMQAHRDERYADYYKNLSEKARRYMDEHPEERWKPEVKAGTYAVRNALKERNGYLYVLTERLLYQYVYKQQDTSLGGWQSGEGVGGLTQDTTLEELDALIAAKEAAGEAPLVYFKGLPTTVYGATNVEEGWCEAFSYYIVYGPGTVLPELRAAMRRLLPDMRRNPDADDDADDGG
jgi:hypothetical protein